MAFARNCPLSDLIQLSFVFFSVNEAVEQLVFIQLALC